MKQYRNYLFDLYGTLVDIHTDEQKEALWLQMSIFLGTEGGASSPRALKQIYYSQLSQLEAEARELRGSGAEIDIAPVFAAIYQAAGVQAGEEDVARLAKAFRVMSIEKLRLFPGVLDLMKRLKERGKGVYLVSNAQALFTLPELRALGLESFFDGIVISSQEGLKKPDEDLFRLALQRYGLNPSESVFVGNDDMADCWGSHQVGLDSMYICTEQSPKRTKPLPSNCRELKTIAQVF